MGRWLVEVWAIFWTLFKVMFPMLLLVRFIELMGWVESLAHFVAPLMAWVGLPGELGLVWVSTMFSSIYTGMAVFYQLGIADSLTVAQVSVLGILMLLAHGLPVEVAIAKSSGVSVIFTLLLRIGCALLLGAIMNAVYLYGHFLQEPLSLQWQPVITEQGWSEWLLVQGQTFLAALIIIASLTLLIRVLRRLGVEKLIHRLLAPLLRAMGIGKQATNIIIVGLTLGLSFGGGLLIRDARSGKISGKDVFMAMAFLGLCHSMIEDTLLLLLLGADLSAVLWARLLFSLLFIALLAKCMRWIPEHSQQQWLYRCYRSDE